MAERVADIILEAQARADVARRSIERGDLHVSDLAQLAENHLDELLGAELVSSLQRALLCPDPAGALAGFTADTVRAFAGVFVELLEVTAYLTHQAGVGFSASDTAVLRRMVDDFNAVSGRSGGLRG